MMSFLGILKEQFFFYGLLVFVMSFTYMITTSLGLREPIELPAAPIEYFVGISIGYIFLGSFLRYGYARLMIEEPSNS